MSPSDTLTPMMPHFLILFQHCYYLMTKHSNLFYEPLGQFLFQPQHMVRKLKHQEHKQLVMFLPQSGRRRWIRVLSDTAASQSNRCFQLQSTDLLYGFSFFQKVLIDNRKLGHILYICRTSLVYEFSYVCKVLMNN